MTILSELDGLPPGGPSTLETTKRQLSIPADDTTDDVDIEAMSDAVNSMVRCWPIAESAVDDDAWSATVVVGASMLAARLFRRKGSPAGVEAFGAEGPVYVMRNDPDIALLLKLGRYAPPGLG